MNRIQFILIAAPLVMTACTQPAQTSTTDAGGAPPPSEIKLPQAALPDGFLVNLELATTPEETTTGLMFRPALAADRGMLLLWPEERLATIWMMNVLIPLDIVFLDNAGEVVELVANAQPCSAEPCPRFRSSRPSRAVLELAAGSAAAHALEVGSRIEFERVSGFPVPTEETEPAN
jgi:uncharacterized membrane protein (UPF0127 family)